MADAVQVFLLWIAIGLGFAFFCVAATGTIMLCNRWHDAHERRRVAAWYGDHPFTGGL